MTKSKPSRPKVKATFKGKSGLARLHAMLRIVTAERRNSKGTQEYLLGWLYGLAEAGALDADTVFSAQQFIVAKSHLDPDTSGIELYRYPSPTTRRVEGKSRYELEREIMEGGPFEDSRIIRIDRLANDPHHELHYLAKHLVFLTRARTASMTDFD